MAVVTNAYVSTSTELESTGSGFYNDVRNGSGAGVTTSATADNFPDVGQFRFGEYAIRESVQRHPCTAVPAGQRTVYASLDARWDLASTSPFTLEWRAHAHNAAYVPGGNLAAKQLLARLPIPAGDSGSYFPRQVVGSEALINAAQASSGLIDTIAVSAETTENRFPGEGAGTQYDRIRLYNSDARMINGTLTTHLLNYTRNAQVQLSDGTEVWLETTGTPTAPGIALRYRTRTGSPTTIATIQVGTTAAQFAMPVAAQALTLAVDPSDNLFVVGRQGSASNSLAVQAFAKGSGHTWVAKALLAVPLLAYDLGGINNVAATWHPMNSGTLAVAVGHNQGTESYNQLVLVALNCRVALGLVAGAVLGEQEPFITDSDGSVSGRQRGRINPTGSNLGIARLGDTTEGVIVTSVGDSTEAYRYSISSSGQISAVAARAALSFTGGARTPQDPNANVRVIPVSSGRFIVQAGTSWALYDSSVARLASGSLSGLAPVWYSARTNSLYHYGVDASRNLVRYGYDIGTGVSSTVTVAATVTPSGSTTLATSVASAALDDRYALVRIAYLAGDGTTHGLVYTADTTLNVAPNSPIQSGSPSTVNAAVANTLSWVFSDPNTADVQTAYQLQVSNASTGVSAYDTGKVSSVTGAHSIPGSTLSNGVGYQWRVRNWDVADAAGAWSPQQALATTSTGVVAIVDPANDYPPGLVSSTLTVEWSFSSGSGATQAEYRVAVVRTDTNTTVYDTGFVVGSGVTEHTITGLLSDVDQRIEVTVKDTNAQTSGVGTRLIRPVFSSPKPPAVTVSAGQVWVDVAVTNPANEPEESFPSAQRNDIYRRTAALGALPAGLYERVGSCGPNETFADYTAGSNVLYEYYALAIGDPGASASEPAPGLVYLNGVWLHDPANPAGTSRQFQYDGDSRRNLRIGRARTELRFVGRRHPVFDFGDEETHVLQVKVLIPSGEDTWAEQVRAAESLPVRGQVVHYRDVRGRALYAVVTDFDETDVAAGTEVAITLTRSEFQGV
ncbi:hypothetical protein [Amycolatopsis albispora]|uniref:Fibronectin type-III domain-containing protein n=1 Tax=Amycolatopsis albispora TaxID=1804986 RepID=A0A344LGZ1_9PSEU|nr:hypothetical protein [Amycolatopsis albispora]AXB47315.1 hypothetical protein A4R43_36720 [Amycolatopsis albispora]